MSKYKVVPISPSRNIEDVIGRARNLSASEIWGDALAAVSETPDVTGLVTALEDIDQWVNRWASADHPIATVARKALAAYRKQGDEV